MTAHIDQSTRHPGETRTSVGDDLRTARAARGLSVSDVEADLRIKAYYIEAIESGDRAALPDKVYVDGFVRNYAAYLQLDPADVLARFDRETSAPAAPRKGFARTRPAPAPTAGARNPLAGYNPPRRSESGGTGIGRSLASLWPLVVLAALGYGIWYGFNTAREAGIIPDNLSVIGATDAEPPVFTANIPDQSMGADGGGASIERPADLSYARLGTQPYWTLPQDERDADGPVSTIDVATAGLFAAHRGMTGVSGLVRDATPLDLTPGAPAVPVSEIAALTRAALAAPLPAAQEDATGSPAIVRDLALVALEDTWIEVRSASGSVRFSGILGPEDSFDIPTDEALLLKVGNAGGLVVELAGKRHGPFGKRGAVMRDIALDRTALAQRFQP